jgi:hypothetical protein
VLSAASCSFVGWTLISFVCGASVRKRCAWLLSIGPGPVVGTDPARAAPQIRASRIQRFSPLIDMGFPKIMNFSKVEATKFQGVSDRSIRSQQRRPGVSSCCKVYNGVQQEPPTYSPGPRPVICTLTNIGTYAFTATNRRSR